MAQYQEQLASLMGHFFADALLYPLETIVHRLHMQGCRTIVDNLDTGREVIPILTRYEGFFDCLSTVLEEEGPAGLFRGFGALILQYAVQFAVIRFSATVVGEVAKVVRQEGNQPPPPELVAELTQKPQQQQQQQQQPQQQPPQQTRATPLSGASRPDTLSSSPMPRFVSSAENLREQRRQQLAEEQLQREAGDDHLVGSSQSSPAGVTHRRKIFPTDYGE